MERDCETDFDFLDYAAGQSGSALRRTVERAGFRITDFCNDSGAVGGISAAEGDSLDDSTNTAIDRLSKDEETQADPDDY